MSYLTPFFNFPLVSSQGHNYCWFLPISANISHLFLSFSSSQPFSHTVQPYDSKSLLFPYCWITIRLGQMLSPGMQVKRKRNVHTLSSSVSERWREKWRLLREKNTQANFRGPGGKNYHLSRKVLKERGVHFVKFCTTDFSFKHKGGTNIHHRLPKGQGQKLKGWINENWWKFVMLVILVRIILYLFLRIKSKYKVFS